MSFVLILPRICESRAFDGHLSFASDAQNTAKHEAWFRSHLWFPDPSSTVMGIQIQHHPTLGQFPHDDCSDWQWYQLVNDTPAICLDSVPSIQPIIEVGDRFNRAKRLCYPVAAQVRRGRLFVSTWRLYNLVITEHPEARFLFHRVARYLQGDAFCTRRPFEHGRVAGDVYVSKMGMPMV